MDKWGERVVDDEYQYDVFISRAGCDADVAVRIATLLRDNGLVVYMQDSDFKTGHDFVERMEVGLDKCRRTLSVVSPAYFESKFTMGEMRAAYTADPDGRQRRLLITRVADCQVKRLYGPRVYKDLFDVDDTTFEQRVVELAEELQDESATPPATPRQEAQIWNVPGLSVNYTVRVELQEALRERLADGGSAAVTQAIQGMGGVGKTQLALWYCHTFADEFDLVWWIDSETDPATDFVELASRLDLKHPDGTHLDVVAENVRRTLEQRSRWLLVFDNVEKPETIAPFRPTRGDGQVLITSRHGIWPPAERLPVGTWSRPESLAFLEKTVGRAEPSADDLTDLLGDLPLALAQAAGYVNATGIGLPDYLERFRGQRERLWKREVPPSDHQKTVRTAWELSRKEIGIGVDVLRLCAFLAPDGLARDIVAAAPNALPPKLAKVLSDEFEFDDVVQTLRQFSLVSIDDGVLSVHRLVQVVVRDGIREGDHAAWVERAARTVRAAIPYEQNSPDTWGPAARMMSHAMTVADRAEEYTANTESIRWNLDRCARACRKLGRYDEARRASTRAMGVAKTVFGEEHGKVASVSSNLGLVELDTGQYPKAKSLLEDAIAIDRKESGADAPILAVRYSILGWIERALANLDEARRLLSDAVDIGERSYGGNRPEMVVWYSSLAMFEKEARNEQEAHRHMRKAVEIAERSIPEDHPERAMCYACMALVQWELHEQGEARRLMERATSIDATFYGENHPRVAENYSILAYFAWEVGNWSEATDHAWTVHDIWTETLGSEHPNTMKVTDWLRENDPHGDRRREVERPPSAGGGEDAR